MLPRAKFQVCSFTRFGDMFEGVPNFIGVRPRQFSEFLFVHFGEIVHVHPYAKFEVCSYTHFEDNFVGLKTDGRTDGVIIQGVPNFIRVT